jgi:pyridoxal phosphate enzyme (YggS family)
MSVIARNLQVVHERIASAALAASRDSHGIRLLAVSKTFGPDAVLAAVQAGQRAFGENYLHEALDKMAMLNVATRRAGQSEPLLEWHFIGPIQSNKTRPIAEHFDWVHSVEREKIARRLSDQRPANLAPLNICLQINISDETSKSGATPELALELARAVAAMPRLRLRGLMAIPEPAEGIERQRVPFRQLRELFDSLRENGLELDTLSMGMSGDLDAAIAEGATIVRVGTAIFGPREA